MTTLPLSQNDWTEILKGREFIIGSTVLVIEPISIAAIAKLTIQLRAVFKSAMDAGLKAENIEDPEKLGELFNIVLTNAPALLEVSCGLHRDDIARLPLTTGICLLKEIIEVNIESQDDFTEAVKSLGKMLAPTAKKS